MHERFSLPKAGRHQPLPYFPFRDFLARHFDRRVSKVALEPDAATAAAANGGMTALIRGARASLVPRAGRRGRKPTTGREDALIVHLPFPGQGPRAAPCLRGLLDADLHGQGAEGYSVVLRPGELTAEACGLLETIAARRHVWLEFETLTARDETLAALGLAHRFADLARDVETAGGRGVLLGAHLTLGLPGETGETAVDTARQVCDLEIDGLKIRPASVRAGAAVEAAWRSGAWRPPEAEEYVSLAVSALEAVPQWITLLRLCDDTRERGRLAPHWPDTKAEILLKIEEEFYRRGSWQGKFSTPLSRRPAGS